MCLFQIIAFFKGDMGFGDCSELFDAELEGQLTLVVF